MKCRECGKQVSRDDRICSDCGALLKKAGPSLGSGLIGLIVLLAVAGAVVFFVAPDGDVMQLLNPPAEQAE